METKKTNWREEFEKAGGRTNLDTAKILAAEAQKGHMLTAAEIQFVTDLLGRDALPPESRLEREGPRQ